MRGGGGPVLLATAMLACAGGAPEPSPLNRPSESLLEVASVLRRHIPDDTYRHPPARDFTGRNVYRASLLRLENLERARGGALRAGTWDEVIPFSKGRALERLRAYDLAAAAYLNAARFEGALQQQARRAAALCSALAEAVTIGPKLDDASRPADVATLEERITRGFDARAALLAALEQDAEGLHYATILLEEHEHLDIERAGLLLDLRRVLPNGDIRALAALQRNVTRHRESKNANRHLLALADLYGELAREYVEENPPESLRFDPAHFGELVESGVRIYESVSNQDGATEKLEAARRLEAFLAFTLRVDRDRFSP